MTPPPRLVARLLTRILPPEDCDEVIGDLDEEFYEQRQTRGQILASWWYWRQGLKVAWSLRTPPSLIDVPGRSRMISIDDLRFALRRLAKQPSATAASAITLACAIGASMAAWSLLSGVLLHPLPVTDPDRLAVVGARRLSKATKASAPSPLENEHIYPLYPAVRSLGVFGQVAAGGSSTGLVTTNGETTSRPLFFASDTFFETIGVRLQAGRGFSADDDRPGAPPVAILSNRFWQRTFNASPDALGQHVLIGQTTVTIVGISAHQEKGLGSLDDACSAQARPLKALTFARCCFLRVQTARSASMHALDFTSVRSIQ